MHIIELSIPEMIEAARVGCQRKIQNLAKNNQNRNFDDSNIDTWATDINGAAGELAVAKFLGLIWPGATEKEFVYGAPDLISLKGTEIEVRTRKKDNYELQVKPRDSNVRYFVLVTGEMPRFKIRGWIIGQHAKRDEWFKSLGDNPKAYFVPTERLNQFHQFAEPSA